MSKKTRREKELSRLRREIEILKAQKSWQGYTPSPPQLEEPEPRTETPKEPPPKNLEKAEIQRVDLKFIKKDLVKTVILSTGALLAIAIIYLLRGRIPFL